VLSLLANGPVWLCIYWSSCKILWAAILFAPSQLSVTSQLLDFAMTSPPRISGTGESIQTPDTSQDEAFARYLQEEEDRAGAARMEDPARTVPIIERNISEAKRDPKYIEQQARIDGNKSGNHTAEDIEETEKTFLERSESDCSKPDSSHEEVASELREDNRSDEVYQSVIDDENIATEATAAVQEHSDPAVSTGENQDLRLNVSESRLVEFEMRLKELSREMELIRTPRDG